MGPSPEGDGKWPRTIYEAVQLQRLQWGRHPRATESGSRWNS